MKIRIVVADDHPLVIKGLQQILSTTSDMEMAGSYTNGRELLSNVTMLDADVFLLDIHMPGCSGEEVAGVLVERYPQKKVIALTNEDNVYYIKNMLRKGVHGYVLKTTTEDRLVNAVRTVWSGKQYIESDLMQKVVNDTLHSKKDLSAQPELSGREKEVLQYIAMDLTSRQIADKLFVSKRTVDYYRICLITKFGVKNVGALVKKGMQLGYI